MNSLYSTKRGEIRYHWSQKLAESGFDRLDSKFDQIELELADTVGKMIVIVNEHLLHPIHACFTRQHYKFAGLVSYILSGYGHFLPF